MKSVPDPDLEMRGGGGPGAGGGLPKTFFRPFGLHFGPKIREGVRAPGPSPESATGNPHPFFYKHCNHSHSPNVLLYGILRNVF